MAESTPEATPNEGRIITLEKIEEETGFRAIAEYPDFSRDQSATSSAFEDFNRLRAESGERNVLLSMYEGSNGKIHLGMFVRK